MASDIPGPAKERLLFILRLMESAAAEGRADRVINSGELENLTGWSSHTIRKDISCLSPRVEGEAKSGEPFGTSSGYSPGRLIPAIRRALGVEQKRKCCVAGLGRLGSAFLNLDWNAGAGEGGEFELAAGFDSNVNRVEILSSPAPLFPAYKMAEVIGRFGIEIALLCVPVSQAQSCAEKLVASGIRGIVNFAPTALVLPAREGAAEVAVRNVFVLDQLRALSLKI